MAVERERTPAREESASPLAAGLEAGLVGAAVAVVLQLISLFLKGVPLLSLVTLCLGLLVWLGVGLLAAYWLRGKGATTAGRQAQAGAVAGLLTALVDRVANMVVSLLLFRGQPMASLLPPEVVALMPPEVLAGAQGGFWFAFAFCSVTVIVLGAIFGALGGLVGAQIFPSQRAERGGPAQAQARPYSKPYEQPPKPAVAPEIQPAAEALQQGDKAQARRILAIHLRKNPRDEKAWLLLERALDDPNQRRDCLRRVLAINPSNTEASDRLYELEREMGM